MIRLATVMKVPTSFRLSNEARKILAVFAQRLGITQAAVLELAIRRYAETEGAKKR